MDNGERVLVCGDCLEYLDKLTESPGSGSGVKAIFADIPDNLGLGYIGYNDEKEDSEYYNWVELLILKSLLRCKIFWLSFNAKHMLEIMHRVRNVVKYRHAAFGSMMFIWRYTFSQYNDNDCAVGYRPILRLMRWDTRIYTDKIRVLSERQRIGDKRAGGERDAAERVIDNVFLFPRIVGNSWQRKDYHPTQHPIELMQRIVDMSVREGETFVDLCVGTGTTLRVKSPARIVGVELSKFYCDKIIESFPSVVSMNL